MSSEHPFDQALKRTLDGYQADVAPDWSSFERTLQGTSVAPSAQGVSRSIHSLSIAAAVVAGGALMWVAKPMVEEALSPAPNQGVTAWEGDGLVWGDASDAQGQGGEGAFQGGYSEEAQTFRAAWDDFMETSDLGSLGSGLSSTLSESELLEIANAAGNVGQLTSEESRQTEIQPDADGASNRTTSPVVHSNEGKDSEGLLASGDIRDAQTANTDEEKILAELPFNASVKEACQGVEVAFELSGIDRAMSFLWNFGDGHFSSDPVPVHRFDRPGTYDITLSVRPPGEGSIRTRTIQNMITVLPRPEAQFSWEFQRSKNNGEVVVVLQDQTLDASSSQWVVDGQVSKTNRMALTVPRKYPVNLVTSNKFGCLDDASHDIVMGDRHGILAQARFSPNGDGHYDTFMPHGLIEMKDAWTLVIHSQQGEEVYRAMDSRRPWDGRLPSGDWAHDREVFQWTVTCVSQDGQVRLFTDRLRVER
ncbi:MAG: PKD domain-containing protein [Bacteroidetes bacterium]|nr:PKD domain-containing protein [Bacteroidota bacterium]MDA0904379.1 PKD domain-containing protein [Bacteroidota bacterium]MDA1243048.1 PKD domain-containing protein [Bacteroidota bacterium]